MVLEGFKVKRVVDHSPCNDLLNERPFTASVSSLDFLILHMLIEILKIGFDFKTACE